ncbi:TlpA family protein disulfide reductase [Pseudobacter ginsenosidimutans]|uniref:Peroxiredoxin n=1 Tax=Pseudobacter ginsenosidimutans TaxID=661488 RepID=A0A4Q7N4N9_9BACT|nr:TlpA disulfide reductase family protein [Pseudobacter ginsenosidimutans]RZS75969.1 peroxiredoxin [Pseudobacter ginsenosidimutans]
MKKFFVFALALTAAATAGAQTKAKKKNIVIKGQVQFLNPEKYAANNKVWIGFRDGREYKAIDSVVVKEDGKWQFTVDASRPRFYDLEILKWDRITVWGDADATINCRGYDTAKMKIKNNPYIFIEGSADNQFLNLLNHIVYRDYQTMIAVSKEMYYAGKSTDTTWSAYLKGLDPYRTLGDDFRDRLKVLIRAYQDRPVALAGIKMLNWEKNQDFIMPILTNLKAKYPWFTEIAEHKKKVEDNIAQAKLLKPGMPVPVVSYPDVNGKNIGTADYKGKYLLIDFWASWCGPCRQAIPKVRALYDLYKEKGFDVLSISIDTDRKAWIKAMDDEQMPWAQTLSPDKNKTMDKFLFSGIPTLYLIDREGKIVQSYTGYSTDLEAKLKEAFSK